MRSLLTFSHCRLAAVPFIKMGGRLESLVGGVSTVYHKFGRHLLPIVVLVSFTFLGGLTFMFVERPNDQARIDALRLFFDDSKSEFLRYIGQVATDRNMTPKAKLADNIAALQEFQAKLLYLLLLQPDEFPGNSSQVIRANRYGQRQLFERLSEVWQERKPDSWRANRTSLALDWYIDHLGMHKWTQRRLADSSWNLWGAMFYGKFGLFFLLNLDMNTYCCAFMPQLERFIQL